MLPEPPFSSKKPSAQCYRLNGMVIRAIALVTDCAPGKWEKSSTRDAAVGPFFPAYTATRLRTEPFDGIVSAYNPSVLSNQDDPESYLSSAGSLAAESFRHQVHSLNSPEQQSFCTSTG